MKLPGGLLASAPDLVCTSGCLDRDGSGYRMGISGFGVLPSLFGSTQRTLKVQAYKEAHKIEGQEIVLGVKR